MGGLSDHLLLAGFRSQQGILGLPRIRHGPAREPGRPPHQSAVPRKGILVDVPAKIDAVGILHGRGDGSQHLDELVKQHGLGAIQ